MWTFLYENYLKGNRKKQLSPPNNYYNTETYPFFYKYYSKILLSQKYSQKVKAKI